MPVCVTEVTRYQNDIASSKYFLVECCHQLLHMDEIIRMPYLDHEKLDVYQTAVEFVVFIESIVKQFPKGRSYLVDQLQRAASSVVLNITEGAGEFSANEKIRFYR